MPDTRTATVAEDSPPTDTQRTDSPASGEPAPSLTESETAGSGEASASGEAAEKQDGAGQEVVPAPSEDAATKSEQKPEAEKAPAEDAAPAEPKAKAEEAPAEDAARAEPKSKSKAKPEPKAEEASVEDAAPAKSKPKKAPAKKTPAKPRGRKVPAKRVRARKGAGSARSKGRRKKQTSFRVGDKVVHPHHGAAEIVKRSKLDLAGEPRNYFELEIATESSLKVLIPVDTIDETIRPVITKTTAAKVLQKFKEDPQDSGSNWSRWYKVLNEKMTSGDIFQVAEVVRDLTHAQHAKGISPALKRMLSKARTTLSSELAFALRITPEQAIERIDRALPKPETPDD